MKMTIGQNIKRLRLNKNITQEKLSEVMNVTCASVSKWERGETYPDITSLQPLAYFFGVSLDELMGYNEEKIQKEIDDVIGLYRKYIRNNEYRKAREIIVKAYQEYPNDYRIMCFYMWNIGGDMADNNPLVLLEHKDEFLSICNKIQNGCKEEELRLSAWNMQAKILHAEGKTVEALDIYQNKFTNWYQTTGQKSEQLFAKNTEEYYYWVKKNMYELIDFASDKLGRVVFFDQTISLDEKADKASRFGDLMLKAAEETEEPFFTLIAYSFLGRMENDLVYRGGSDENIITMMDKYLLSVHKLNKILKDNAILQTAFLENHSSITNNNILKWQIECYLNAKTGKRAELLQNPLYIDVLNKYR